MSLYVTVFFFYADMDFTLTLFCRLVLIDWSKSPKGVKEVKRGCCLVKLKVNRVVMNSRKVVAKKGPVKQNRENSYDFQSRRLQVKVY